MTAGPKTVHFDRVEWTVVPDPATKAAAHDARASSTGGRTRRSTWSPMLKRETRT